MSYRCCPNPDVWQQLSAGPLGARIDTFARQLLDQGYASWRAKSMARLLAYLSCWLQRHALTVMASTNSALMLFCGTALGAIIPS